MNPFDSVIVVRRMQGAALRGLAGSLRARLARALKRLARTIEPRRSGEPVVGGLAKARSR